MTDCEAQKWFEHTMLEAAKKNGLAVEPTNHGKQCRLNHDIWNAYDYGNVVRFVYIKCAPKDKVDPPLWGEPKAKPKTVRKAKPEHERFASSINRAKARIFELAMCNEFTHFCTFTQDKEKRSRFDLQEFRTDFAMLVRNLNRDRNEDSKIKYLLIPEQHKDGAWHMHGLLKGLTSDDLTPFKLSDRIPVAIKRQIKDGTPVFDWHRYRRAFGFFTCTEIDNVTACSKYITKYVSKDLQRTVRENGQHLFFASQGLNGRATIAKNNTDPCPISEWDFENDYVKIKEIVLR